MNKITSILFFLILAMLFAVPRQALAAIALVQKAKSPQQFATASDNRTSSDASFAVPPVAGDLLIAIVASDTGTPTTPAGWLTAVSDAASGATMAQAIFYKIAGASEPQTVISPENRSLEIYEYSGIDTANPFLIAASGTGVNSGTVSPASVPALLVAAFSVHGSLANTDLYGEAQVPALGAYTNSFTEEEAMFGLAVPCNYIDTACYAFSSADRIVNSSGSYSTSVGSAGRGQIAGFKEAVAPSQTPTAPASISGTVTYGNAIGAPNPRFISNALISGTGSPNVFTNTAAPGATAGQYTLTGFGSGSYTVTPTKSSGQNGITSNDAARIAQHVASTVLLTTDNQKVSADVSNNGVISSNDAAQIARFVAALGPPIGLTNQWRFFLPPGPTFPVGSSPTSRSYASVTSNLAGEDYVGLLIGDVTGNWTNTGARAVANKPSAADSGPKRAITINLPNLETVVEKEVIVPVSIQDLADKGVISYEFDLAYDPSVIQPAAEVADLNGTVSRGLVVVTNANEPGFLRVVVYGAMPMAEDGVLLNLKFTAVGKPGSVSRLSFETIMFNEGEPRVSTLDGQIELF